MGKYKKGTQEMLDAAKDDATLLPFDTVFVTRRNEETSQSDMPDGVKVVRGASSPGIGDHCGSKDSVAFMSKSLNEYWFVDSTDIIPAKKSKPKKWQNGTQAQLDAAKDDARLIPKKTYFLSKIGNTIGMVVYRIPHHYNDETSVLMYASEIASELHCAEDLESIND